MVRSSVIEAHSKFHPLHLGDGDFHYMGLVPIEYDASFVGNMRDKTAMLEVKLLNCKMPD